MRIGILTVHDAANFGSFLQAFALSKVLSDRGHDVSFITIQSKLKMFKSFILRPKSIEQILFNYRNYKKFSEDIKVLKTIKLKDINKDSFDIMIIGSDELWNVRNPYFTQKCFYGIDIPVKKKFAYALSIGSSDYNDLKKYPSLIEGIKSLDKVFARDKNTQDAVEKLVGYKCDFTCDPTLLIDVKNLMKEYKNPIKDKYLFVYSYGFSEIQKDYIRKFALENNLKVVSSGLYNSWCDINISCSPLEFSSIIQGAECVVTTTFHGVIFSILNRKIFVTFVKKSKVEDILNRTELVDRVVNIDDGFDDFKKKLNSDIDFNKAYEKILKMRKESLKYIDNEILK